MSSNPADDQIIISTKYEKLQKLLLAGEWKAGNQETLMIMLQIAGREEEGGLKKDSITNFPCEDLRMIDQLWVKYSHGRFGLSVQKNIWLECGGKMDYKTECKLGDLIGWRVNGKWLLFRQGIFSLEAPYGHLPVIRFPTDGSWYVRLVWLILLLSHQGL